MNFLDRQRQALKAQLKERLRGSPSMSAAERYANAASVVADIELQMHRQMHVRGRHDPRLAADVQEITAIREGLGPLATAIDGAAAPRQRAARGDAGLNEARRAAAKKGC